MPFVPPFSAIFPSLLADNLLALFARDMKLALDAIYPADNLPDFTQRTVGNFIRLDMPALAIEVMRGGADVSADESFKARQIRMNIYLTVDDSDPTNAARKLEKYMAALEAVLDKAAKPPMTDFLTGVPSGKVFGFMPPELSFEYNQVAKDANESAWLKSVTYDFTLRYNQH